LLVDPPVAGTVYAGEVIGQHLDAVLQGQHQHYFGRRQSHFQVKHVDFQQHETQLG
jgi:hypothetical protein